MIINHWEVLYYLGLSAIWVWSEPTILLRAYFNLSEEAYEYMNNTTRFIYRAITCLPCSSFWITLMISGEFKLSVIVTLSAYLLDRTG